MFSFLKRSAEPNPGSNLPPLQFHNTLSCSTEGFSPLSAHEVKMYNCGPTVYDRQHIGNLRPYVFADVLRQTLECWGYGVKQIINITDVGHLTSDSDEGGDKMELGARRAGKDAREIAKEISELFFEDLELLGIDTKKILFPKATDYIPEQIALVQALEEKGYTYPTRDGIYFNTAKFAPYGKLGNINLAGLEAGARVEENPDKRRPYDFALWKFSRPDEQRQQEWESPWGVGFPGWHIECTAMIFKLLGKQIDIHTGGIDHIPVHHNNEIAEAEAITGKPFVRYWMHGAFITIEGKKISKSLGNTFYLSQLIDRGLSPRSLRYLFLTAHYRSPLNFTWDAIEAADVALKRLHRSFLELKSGDAKVAPEFMRAFHTAMGDDLDTPKALARVWELVHDASVSPAQKHASLIAADTLLGLGFSEGRAATRLTVVAQSGLSEDARQMVADREDARRNKDFAMADKLRLAIEALGYDITDTPEGPEITSKR